MHEMSLTEALLEQVSRHVPPGAVLRSVEVEAGAAQGIEPEAMQFAWQALTRKTRYDGADLKLTILPWTLRCAACGRQWQSEDAIDICPCGQPARVADAGSHLTLMSLEYDEPDDDPSMTELHHESSGG